MFGLLLTALSLCRDGVENRGAISADGGSLRGGFQAPGYCRSGRDEQRCDFQPREDWVAHLVSGDRNRPITAYRPASVACLQRDDEGAWAIVWMIRPELLDR